MKSTNIFLSFIICFSIGETIALIDEYSLACNFKCLKMFLVSHHFSFLNQIQSQVPTSMPPPEQSRELRKQISSKFSSRHNLL